MKYAYKILYVENVLKTIEFYEQAFRFQRKFITSEKDYGELISGEITISFASIELGNSNFKDGFQKSSLSDKPFGIELAFEKAKKAGATEVEKLTTKPWEQKVGYGKDNNGFLIEICTPLN